MIITILVVLGLALGSFINALVWRLHEQSREQSKKKPDREYLKKLSISNGRSMCLSCHHKLGAKDLLPVLSWLSLRGKCRYCRNPISVQYPLVELATAGLFIVSYVWWPQAFNISQDIIFGLWLVLLTGLMALLVYDFKWKLLPNKLIYPLSYIAGAMALVSLAVSAEPIRAMLNIVLALIVGGGVFYILFQVSAGKWIGGGDVKLGWLLGFVLGTPAHSFLMIFLAALLGSLVSLPLLMSHRLKRSSTIPFGPFLIIGAIIVQLFGHTILLWYQKTFLAFTV